MAARIGTWVAAFILGLLPGLLNAQPTLDWFIEGRPTQQAVQVVDVLSTSEREGLSPDDYRAHELAAAIGRARQGAALSETALAHLDAALTASIRQYLHDLRTGRLDPRSARQYFKASPADEFDAAWYLASAISQNRVVQALHEAGPVLPLYGRLRRGLAEYRALSGHPAWQTPLAPPPAKGLEENQAYDGMDVLRRRLAALGDMPADASVPPLYGGAVQEGLKRFQERHGLVVDGLLGPATYKQLEVSPAQRARQIELTMERLRWTPAFPGPRIIAVNIPEFVLRAYEIHDGQAQARVEMKVIVGKALDNDTPVFNEDMRYIEFSPYWNVPPSIARAETLPRLRRDPAYLDRQGFEFVAKDGTVVHGVSDAYLDAVQRGDLRIRQRPGPDNALGDIKFIFPNDHNIYLHHTPAPQLFQRSRRDFSHGCIRIEDPVALAKFVLVDEPAWDEASIRAAMGTGRSRTIRLKQPVPVVIAYSTVNVRNDKVYFFDDIYGHDALLDQALKRRKRPELLS
ncbi:MAG TPA: L,D-transpeptidase family protein [Candidimonas sp.]|nr:L,D-transpeptidase family protein [Candidimonas sp.]